MNYDDDGGDDDDDDDILTHFSQFLMHLRSVQRVMGEELHFRGCLCTTPLK